MRSHRLFYVTAIIIGLALSFSGCKRLKLHKKELKSDSIKYKEDNRLNLDTIAIFSEDYKLIREVEYVKTKDWETYESYIKGYPMSDTLTGDFNGNGIKDTAWFHRTEDVQYYIDNNECKGLLSFSDDEVKPLDLGNCCGGTFKNEGDLDGNGTDEIGVMCSKAVSGCRYYYVFTYGGNDWKLLIPPIESSLSMREAGIVLVEKDNKNEGHIVVRNMLYFNNKAMPKKYLNQGGGSCSRSNVREFRINLDTLSSAKQ
jgi:hypothetical protein